MRLLFRAKRGENFYLFAALLFDVQEQRDTHVALDLGRRVEQSWPYYLMCRRPPDTRDTGLRLAHRAEERRRGGGGEEEEAGQD